MATTREERAAARAAKKAARDAEDAAYRREHARKAAASRLVRETAVRLFGDKAGCGDGGCVFGHLGGMHTNGGCRCLAGDIHDVRMSARMLARVAHELANGGDDDA